MNLVWPYVGALLLLLFIGYLWLGGIRPCLWYGAYLRGRGTTGGSHPWRGFWREVWSISPVRVQTVQEATEKEETEWIEQESLVKLGDRVVAVLFALWAIWTIASVTVSMLNRY